jgi:hypothetical protein
MAKSAEQGELSPVVRDFAGAAISLKTAINLIN